MEACDLKHIPWVECDCWTCLQVAHADEALRVLESSLNMAVRILRFTNAAFLVPRKGKVPLKHPA